jgi:hypothetical protein
MTTERINQKNKRLVNKYSKKKPTAKETEIERIVETVVKKVTKQLEKKPTTKKKD